MRCKHDVELIVLWFLVSFYIVFLLETSGEVVETAVLEGVVGLCTFDVTVHVCG